MSSWQEFLENIYFQIKEPGAFAGSKKLQTVLKHNGYNVSLEKIKQWTQNQDSYSLFKPVRYRFKRNRVITTGIDHMWDGDLADVSNISQHNDGFSYFLVLIDVFSRHLWIQPVKSKNQNDIYAAFKRVFESTERRPSRLRTDKGKEFTNKKVKQYLQQLGIKAFTTKNETKANYAERVIRTIKTLLYRYFHQKQSYRYVEILQDLVHNYNNRPHDGLNLKAPSDINSNNEAIIWKEMYIDTARKIKKQTYKFKIGDNVRISHLKYVFQRDYQQKWTEEYFIITERFRKSSRNMYKIKDLADESIDGTFYEKELQKISKDQLSMFRIEKVIRRRKDLRLVKWLGWPAKFNSWINANDITEF